MNIRYKYNYVTGLLKRYGFRGLVLKTLERRESSMLSYGKRYAAYMPKEEELDWQREHIPAYAPLISIVIPTYETPEKYLKELLDSVMAQTYSNWELCLADGSRTGAVENVVKAYAADKRIRYQRLKQNGGISENTNGGFAMARGAYIALMDHDDLLTQNALYEMVQCLNTRYEPKERAMAMLYSDEDKINGDGSVHSRPHFKPDFNREFLRHNNYFCHFLLFSAGVWQAAGGLRKEYDGAQDYDFVLRCIEAGAIVKHIPKILYHWRIHEGSTAGNSADKAYAFDNGCRAIAGHLERIGEPGRVYNTPNLGVYQVVYDLTGEYTVAVVAEEQSVMEQLLSRYGTTFEKDRYTLHLSYYQESFSGKILEQPYTQDYVFYIEQGIELRDIECIEGLLRHCQHTKTAAATAKIFHGNHIESCGYIYDQAGNLYPAFEGLQKEYKGYFLHAVIPQNVSVVSMGCTMFRRDALDKIRTRLGEFTGLYRGADVSFLLKEAGYELVAVPQVLAGRVRRKPAEQAVKQQRKFAGCWESILKESDICYNENLELKPKCTYKMKDGL